MVAAHLFRRFCVLAVAAPALGLLDLAPPAEATETITAPPISLAEAMTDKSATLQTTASPATRPAATTMPAEDESQPVDPVEAFIQKTRNPLPWWKWGADVRLREIYIGNGITLDKKDPNHETHWQRYRARWWNTFTPLPSFEFNMRMAWEGRYFDKPDSRDNWNVASVLWDVFNIKLKEPGDLPFTITAGRQDLMLGDRWLVMDATPLDGSSTLYFDAVRLTLDVKPVDTTVDLIYLEMDAEGHNWITPVSDQDNPVTEQDETGAIVWLTNRSIPKMELNGYFMYKQGSPALANGYDAEIYTFGTLVTGQIGERWRYSTGLAGQFGHKNDVNLCALGSNNRLTYLLKDKWNSQLRLDYEYLSGDDADTDTNEAFDLLWGRWPRWSELYAVYTYIPETRVGDFTNLHRVSFGYTCNPVKPIEFLADYHLLFADQNTLAGQTGFSQSGCFRGQLLTALLRYKFSEHVSTHLLGEFFFPGDYYSNERNDVGVFLRSELVFTW